jgi:NADH-quinone oxidoreductase subunit N
MIMLYISIEFISLLSYLLTGLTYRVEKSLEASVKYSIYGGVSSGIMLFGLSFLYGLTGSLDFNSVSQEILSGPISNKIMLISGITFFLSGMGYKLAMAPFHTWCPDVYEGAATPITYFYIVPRIAGFGIILIIIKTAFAQHNASRYVYETIAIISAFTMTLGNFSALNQTGIKRLLAYSSIAHGGYALALFSIMGANIDEAIVYYMFAYLLMTGGTFIIFQILSSNGEGDLNLFHALAFRGKNGAFLALAMAGFAFSLIGIPPFAGFMGKYLVFSHLMEDQKYWLAILMGINTIISIYYYMKFLHQSYFMRDESAGSISVPVPVILILVIISVMNIFVGVFPGIIMHLI